MSGDADRREVSDEYRDATIADEPLPASRTLCQTILSALNRDHGLRRTYLRRRWQGLIE